MKDLRGKVAVVTGAASGIGLALARKFGAEGMRVVLADVEKDALQSAAQGLEADGVEALAVPTDVSQAEQVEALAQATLKAFDGIHVVCNNAGVFAGGVSWEAPLKDYEWLINVNVWGVIHGIRTFTPLMLERGEEGHIINTASMAAVTSMPWTGVYYMTKHAVLSMSETLYHELTLMGAKVGASVLCPELIATQIDQSDRNRPDALRSDGEAPTQHEVVMQAIHEGVKTGVPPEKIAERVVGAIRENRFYILADDAWRKTCEVRLEDIRLGRNPTFAPPVDV